MLLFLFHCFVGSHNLRFHRIFAYRTATRQTLKNLRRRFHLRSRYYVEVLIYQYLRQYIPPLSLPSRQYRRFYAV